MGAVQLVLLEMLADFHVQGKEGAKAIGDQLLSSWPISPSHRMMQELRQEMKNELDQRIEHVSTQWLVMVDRRCGVIEHIQVVMLFPNSWWLLVCM